jgi:uncharacterized protein
MTQKKLCIFHKNCLDGFASAFVVGSVFGIGNVEFLAADYYDPIPDITDRDVYIVDFSYPPAVLLPELPKARSVVMLDHHEGARKKWGLNWDTSSPGAEFKNFVSVFDTKKSGVGVVWDFFYNPPCAQNVKLPELLKYIQDYDLYDLKYDQTRAIQAALTSTSMIVDQDFARFSEIFNHFE